MILWSVAEAAKQLSVSKRTLERLIAKGEIAAIRIGRCRRLEVEAVQAYIKQLSDQEKTCTEGKRTPPPTIAAITPDHRPHRKDARPPGKGNALAEIQALINAKKKPRT